MGARPGGERDEHSAVLASDPETSRRPQRSAARRPRSGKAAAAGAACRTLLLEGEGGGDLVWMSWLGAQKKGKLQPSRASTCVAVSKNAAVVLTEWMNSRDLVAGHMDVMLADRLSQRQPGLEALAVHASFVSPSRGRFQEHQSGCECESPRARSEGQKVIAQTVPGGTQ